MAPSGGINQSTLKPVLFQLAHDNKAQWHLASASMSWAEDTSKSIRAMMRAVSQALCRPDRIPKWARVFAGNLEDSQEM